MMASNGAKKSWLERMFRGDAVSDSAYGAQETAQEEQQGQQAAMDGTYARQPQTQSLRKDNVVDFSKAHQARASGTGDTTGSFTRPTGTFTREGGTSAREYGGGGSGGGFGLGGVSETGEAYVIFKKLKDFTSATQVADRMTEQKIVILNLESCDDETARRVLDFLGGVAYACSCMVKRIAGRVFMITPKGVSADGEFLDEAKSSTGSINYDE